MDDRLQSLVSDLRSGRRSRRGFLQGAAALGMSAGAASVLARHAVAQDATPGASPAATPGGSPVAIDPVTSINREEYNALIRDTYSLEEPGSPGGQLVYVQTADISTLNPTLVNDIYSGLVTGAVFEALVVTSVVDGTPAPGLADYWEIASDGLTYTFHLNQTAMWHDGMPVTAADVLFTFESVLAEDSLSPRRSTVLTALDPPTLRAVDDYTIEFKTIAPLATAVLDICGQFGIMPRHIWESIPFAEWGTAPGSTGQDATQVIGSGSFRFNSWTTGDNVSLLRNDAYWDTQNLPVIDEFIYRVIADPQGSIQSLRTGESDISDIPAQQVATFETGNPEIVLTDFDTFGFTYYHFFQGEAGLAPFKDANVRKALFYALDRQLVVDTVIQGYGVVANGTIPVLATSYAPDQIRTIYNHDPDMANSLLDGASLTERDGSGYRLFEGQKFSFEFLYAEGEPVYDQLIPYMQQVWGEIGIEMIPTRQPFSTLVDNILGGTYQAAVVGFNWDTTGNQGAMFACASAPPAGFNTMQYCNPAYDELDAQQLRELDLDVRNGMQLELTNIVNDDQAASVVFFAKNIRGAQPRVHNFIPNGFGDFWSLPYIWVDGS